MQIFGIRPELAFDNSSFLYMVSDILATTVQYSSFLVYLKDLCSALEEAPTLDDKVVTLANTTTAISSAMGMVFLLDYPLICDDPKVTSPYKDTRAWTWMTCNEVGYFQTASGELRAKSIDIEYYESICQILFNKGLPDTDATNKEYGGLNPTGTKTIYVNGEFDPWSTLSIKENNTELQRYSYIIDNGHHCDDLSYEGESDSESLKLIRTTVINTLLEWLGENTNQEPQDDDDDSIGGKVAISILGALLGVAIIVIIVLAVKLYKSKSNTHVSNSNEDQSKDDEPTGDQV